MAAFVTMLNSMASSDFAQSCRLHEEWGVPALDLKDCVFDKNIADLTDAQAEDAAELIAMHKLSVYCFSTGFFHADVALGEAEFRARYLSRVPRLLEIAAVMKPAVIRLLAAKSTRWADGFAAISAANPWLMPMYREAAQRIVDAGFEVTVENEVSECVMAGVRDIRDFFAELDLPRKRVFFTYDAQNLWHMGVFPTIEVYRELADLVGYFHLKGGQSLEPGGPLKWSSLLEDASWPVVEIAQAAIDAGARALCLNPSHGEPKEGYDYDNAAKRDIDFVRANVQGVK